VTPDGIKRAALAPLVAACLVAGSCGDGGKPPSQPERLPDAASLIPSAPATRPTPTPTPGATPADEPDPAIPGGGGGSDVSGECGEPSPPAVSRIRVKVHAQIADRTILDATPLVGPDEAYCRLVGFTDGRSFCAVRPEGYPDRQACEAALVGRADDTGRYGPTWSANGRPCDGSDGPVSCVNHSDNQYLAVAYGAGTFRACAATGVCGQIVLP
jgi:hypothetical protein